MAKAKTTDVYAIASDARLSDGAVRLWLFYRRHHLDDKGAYVSDQWAAKSLGWSERKVQRVRAELVNRDLLEVVRRGPKPPSYYPLPIVKDSPPVTNQDSPNMATHDLPLVATLESSQMANQAKDSPQDSPSVSQTIKERTVETEKRRLTPPQVLVNRVIAVGLFGVRPANYAKQAKRADQLLADYQLDDLLAAVETLRGQFPYRDSSETFDVFDLGKQAHKLIAKQTQQSRQAAPHDNIMDARDVRRYEEGLRA